MMAFLKQNSTPDGKAPGHGIEKETTAVRGYTEVLPVWPVSLGAQMRSLTAQGRAQISARKEMAMDAAGGGRNQT
jgi:hypothetical protein